jgi:primosomal replication protein N
VAVNRIRLTGRLIAVGALRYTPAGLPVAEATLQHSGSVIEAGTERRLDFELAAVAIGSAAQTLAAQPLGTELEVDGFIAPASRRSRRLALHITEHRRTSGD